MPTSFNVTLKTDNNYGNWIANSSVIKEGKRYKECHCNIGQENLFNLTQFIHIVNYLMHAYL